MNDAPKCKSCGQEWHNHLGCEGLCEENKKLKAENEQLRSKRPLSEIAAEYGIDMTKIKLNERSN